jgi:hypothetical protein
VSQREAKYDASQIFSHRSAWMKMPRGHIDLVEYPLNQMRAGHARINVDLAVIPMPRALKARTPSAVMRVLNMSVCS